MIYFYRLLWLNPYTTVTSVFRHVRKSKDEHGVNENFWPKPEIVLLKYGPE